MRHKFFSILLLFSFVAIILQPAMPFVQYYFGAIENTSNDDCCCSQEAEPAKMANNGDAYLKALIKRTCPEKKKEEPKSAHVSNIVFIKTLISETSVVYQLPEDNFNTISDFIIQASLSTYLNDILRPPKQA